MRRMPQAVAGHRSLPGLRTRTFAGPREGMSSSSTTRKRKNAGGRRGLTQLAVDQGKAKAAFDLQVSIGELEQWTEEIFVDGWLRGFYAGKAELAR